ncbi:unnamed protein product [Phytophthora lilii]|uniref:Unnamed protein product n=1 Tax=Phytophthora lilii TaxID=2077276 RepID=A0A9W6TUK3_9STRA|nr:unnamed protein product [Phytophthora lilii]
MSSLHRRQSALNLPSQASSEAVASSTSESSIQPSLSLTDVQDDENTSQGEPSPTCRSYRDKPSKFTRASGGRSTASSRQFALDSNPELYDTQASNLNLGQQDTQHSRRGSRTSSARHLRTLSRDFVMPSIPASSVRHENLTSLKDQFLKIKERFSPSVLPLSNTNTATVTPSCLVAQHGQTTTATESTMAITSVAVPSTQTLLTQSFSSHVDPVNKDNEGSWELPQARVERWYREDDFFKACITCWTMEAGAAIVSKVARVVSEWASDTSSSRPLAGSPNAINPDVSLQWIGRQLWAVTVSLPLTRSGELHAEHITLAHRINQAVAEISKHTSVPLTSSPSTSESLHQPQSQCLANCQTGETRDDEEIEVQPALSPIHLTRSDDEDLDQDSTGNLQSSPFSTLVAEDIEVLCQAQIEDKKRDAEDENVSIGAKIEISRQQDHDEDTNRGQNDDDDDEEEDSGEQVSALPLSWSMLSLSSQPSGSSEHASLQGEFTITDDDSTTDPVAHLAPEKTGWLKKKKRKQHGLGSSWQPRYFELKGNRLYYFASEADGLPRGAVLLDHALVQRGRGDHAMAFTTKAALASSSLSLSAERERQDVEDADTEELRTTTARWTASYQQLGSVQYLRETDPLLWEIHPPEQIAIRKKAARARTRGDYLAIFSRHAETFAQIFLPRPQPISLEQTLRDILPELFLINDTLYGGGEQQQQQQAAELSSTDSIGQQPQQNRGLEHIFEVLDAHIQRFAAAPEERVRAVSALLQACARTISGGDSYFVVHRLLGNPNLIIRPAEARGRPIEIDVSPERPSRFLITVFSAFSFHLLDDVERFGDSNDATGGGMTPAPLLRVRTRHIQEFDFASGTSTRWLKIDVEGRKEDGSPGGGGGGGGGSLARWGSRRQSYEGAESRIGALLDALS